jgi:hypothetical protein
MHVFSPGTPVTKQSSICAVHVCCIANKASQWTCRGAVSLLKGTNNFSLRSPSKLSNN